MNYWALWALNVKMGRDVPIGSWDPYPFPDISRHDWNPSLGDENIYPHRKKYAQFLVSCFSKSIAMT